MAKAKTDEQLIMVKLSDTTLAFVEGAEDIRGRKVFDSTKRF